jgi:short-subunit dehydrogenase
MEDQWKILCKHQFLTNCETTKTASIKFQKCRLFSFNTKQGNVLLRAEISFKQRHGRQERVERMAVVVITGASSGIGEATAQHLADKGHKLVLAARRADKLSALAEALTRRTEVLAVQVDLADPAALEQLARAAIERFGKIDVWVNNAGVGGSSLKWMDESDEHIRYAVTVNLMAPILAARTVLPYMRQAGHGHIINVASVAGHIGTNAIYSATKFGLRGHSEALRREFKPYGINVSVISPGFVRSEMTAHRQMRMPGPEIIAKAIGRLIRRPRREIVVPGWYRLLILLNRYCPWLADRILIPKEGKRKSLGEK